MIVHKPEISRGAFHYMDSDKEAGMMTYSVAGENLIIIDHTEVAPEYNGKGIGKLMVFEAVKFARENNLKILPLCPFANVVFKRTPEIQDVLHHT